MLDLPSPLSAAQTVTIVSDWKNPIKPLDVNNDTLVNALDVLLVVNNINQFGQHALGAAPASGTFTFLDTNGDAAISPLDVLLIVNHINATAASACPACLRCCRPLAHCRKWRRQSAADATDASGELTSTSPEVAACARIRPPTLPCKVRPRTAGPRTATICGRSWPATRYMAAGGARRSR